MNSTPPLTPRQRRPVWAGLALWGLVAVLVGPTAMQHAQAAQFVKAQGNWEVGRLQSYGTFSFDFDRPLHLDGGSALRTQLAPGLVYYVNQALAISAQLPSGYTGSGPVAGASLYQLGLAPKVTYLVDLSHDVSLQPELSLHYAEQMVGGTVPQAIDRRGSRVSAELRIPLWLKARPLGHTGLSPQFKWDMTSRMTLSDKTGALGSGPGMPQGRDNNFLLTFQTNFGIEF